MVDAGLVLEEDAVIDPVPEAEIDHVLEEDIDLHPEIDPVVETDPEEEALLEKHHEEDQDLEKHPKKDTDQVLGQDPIKLNTAVNKKWLR